MEIGIASVLSGEASPDWFAWFAYSQGTVRIELPFLNWGFLIAQITTNIVLLINIPRTKELLPDKAVATIWINVHLQSQESKFAKIHGK
jgi:hypothetical protein